MLISGLFFLKSFIGIQLHKVLVIDIMETVTLLNIICISVLSLYNFKIDDKKQTAVAYTSTSITLFMLVGGVIYHIALLIKRLKKTRVEVEEYAIMVPVVTEPTEVTYSIVERPTPEPPPTPPNMCSDNFDSIFNFSSYRKQ